MCQYDVYPDGMVSSDKPCYRGGIEQYFLGWFEFIVSIISPQMVSIKETILLSTYSQMDGTKWCSCLIQRLWVIYDELWVLINTTHKTVENINQSNKLQSIDRTNVREYSWVEVNLLQIHVSLFIF